MAFGNYLVEGAIHLAIMKMLEVFVIGVDLQMV
jgi:hypothetical protein